MRKTRFLLIFSTILLLLFTLLLAGCSADEPPASEPPAEDPVTEEPPAEDTPAEEQSPEKDPLVIEQGEIVVSDYWQNDPVAVNPCPELTENVPLCFELLGFYKVKTSFQPIDEPNMRCADSLTEAAALVELCGTNDIGADNVAALCEKLSHVDFTQFRLLLLYDKYHHDRVEDNHFQALAHDGAGGLQRIHWYRPTILFCRCTETVLCARFVLVRRTDYNVAHDAMHAEKFYYKYIDFSVIRPGEITVSDYWKNDPVAVNPCPDAVEGTPLCFEQLLYTDAYKPEGDDPADRLYIADDLTEATALIRRHIADGYDGGYSLDIAFEKFGSIDFSQFRLLVFVEYYGSGSTVNWYKLEGLVHDGNGGLTCVMLNTVEDDRVMTDDIAYMARFVLVRRNDFAVAEKALTADRYGYTDPENVIVQGEITVSEYWNGREAMDGNCLNFEQLGVVPVENTNGLYSVDIARNLAEAATLIDRVSYGQSAGCLALNEATSHVDFEQFCLLFVYERYLEKESTLGIVLESAELKGADNVTLTYLYDSEKKITAGFGDLEYVRLLLIRREALNDTVKELDKTLIYNQSITE